MQSIQLERFENYLVLPDHLPEQSYVICPTIDEKCWHVLPTLLNDQILEKIVNCNISDSSDKNRMQIMLQGTFTELERQGNLLSLPEGRVFSSPECSYVLKLAN